MESEPGSSTPCGTAENRPTADEALLDEMVGAARVPASEAPS